MGVAIQVFFPRGWYESVINNKTLKQRRTGKQNLQRGAVVGRAYRCSSGGRFEKPLRGSSMDPAFYQALQCMWRTLAHLQPKRHESVGKASCGNNNSGKKKLESQTQNEK